MRTQEDPNSQKSDNGLIGFIPFIFYAFIVPFSPLFVGVVIAAILPLGGFRDLPAFVLGLELVIIPVVWLAIADGCSTLFQKVLQACGRSGEGWWSQFTSEAIAAGVAAVLFMGVFEKIQAALLVAAVVVLGYHALSPYVESRYEIDRDKAKAFNK